MKRYMSSIVILMVFVFVKAFPSSSSVCQEAESLLLDSDNLSFRLAVHNPHFSDLDNILELYSNFTLDDQHRLLVYPIKARRSVLKENILKKRIFVACDRSLPGQNKIISFCKLIVAHGEELVEIVTGELNAGCFFEPSQSASALDVSSQLSPLLKFHPNQPAFFKNYELGCSDFDTRITPPQKISDQLDSSLWENFRIDGTRDKFLYFGMAYTLPAYRGVSHVNSRLEAFALSSVANYLSQCLEVGDNLIYMYGVVRENFWGSARMRSFGKFVLNLINARPDDTITFSVAMFDTEKPIFEEKEGRAVRSPVKMPRGRVSSLFAGFRCVLPSFCSSASDVGAFEDSPVPEAISPLVISDSTPGYGCFISCKPRG